MKRSLFKHAPFFASRLLSPLIPLSSLPSKHRLFSSNDTPTTTTTTEDNSTETPPSSDTAIAPTPNPQPSLNLADVSNKDLKRLMESYFKGDEEVLPSIMEAILRRRLSGKHAETDDELMEELQAAPLGDVKDKEFESDFEELYETDEEIDNLYNARQYVERKMVKDEYFNMDERKWDEMIKEATEKGFLKDTGECERILEDMLSWDKLLPGLRINLFKSELFGIKVNEDWVARLADILWCKAGSLPTAYLGLPLRIGAASASLWNPVLERLEKKHLFGMEITSRPLLWQ